MKKLVTLIVTIGFFLGGFYFILYQVNQDQSADDSDALFGGELEIGYPYAGFLISYEPGGGSKTCGYTALTDSLAVTAGHCVDNSESIFIGTGEFTTNRSRLVEVSQATQKEGWVQRKDRSQDFAILNFNDTEDLFDQYAEIASPIEGCSFRVVAYGRTENPDESFTKPRKSAKMCATEVNESIFIMTGEEGGICFGDSGSPVFYDGTNKLAGVVASIVLEDPSTTRADACSIGNTAIVVRADANQNIINDTLQSFSASGDEQITITDGNTIQLNVASQDVWDRIGLGNLSSEQRFDYALYLVVGLVAILFVGSFALIVTSSKKASKPAGGEDYYNL